MSSDPIEVLRQMRDAELDDYFYPSNEQRAALDAAIASLSAPKPEGEWVLVRRGDFPAPLGKGHGFSADYAAGFNDCVRYVDDLVPATPKPPPMNDNAVAVNESPDANDKPESAEAVGDRQAWYEAELDKAERQWIDGFSRRYEAGDDVPSMSSFVALWLAERTAPPRPEASVRCGDERYELDAYLWRRESTQEWVLELSGTINDTSFTNRFPVPLSYAPEDAVSLPNYVEQPAAVDEAVAGWSLRHERGMIRVIGPDGRSYAAVDPSLAGQQQGGES